MVNYKNDYINLVVLGSFNPAILTHEFLVEECGFDLPAKPDRKGPPMPVVASIDYGSVAFFADLGRLQITQKNCDDPKSSKLPAYLRVYLEKLPYTPITKCGANFSCEVTVGKKKVEAIEERLRSDRGHFRESLESEAVDIEVCFELDDGQERVRNWAVRTRSRRHEASTVMKVARMATVEGVIKVDFNYEVGNLDTERKRLNSVTSEYGEVVDLFNRQVQKLFEG